MDESLNLISLVYRKWEILDELFPNEEYYLGELAEKLEKDRSNIGTHVSDLKEEKLVSTREGIEQKPGVNRKYVSLTERGRNILQSFYEASELEEETLREPRGEEINFLLTQFRNLGSEEVYEEATRDILKLCKDTQIWGYEKPSEESMKRGKIWPFLENIIDSEDKREKGLSVLLTVIENALREDREDIVKDLKVLFEDKIKEFARIDKYSTANEILEKFMEIKEEWDFYRPKLEKAIREYEGPRLPPHRPLHKFIEWEEHRVRKWLYELMSDDDEKTRKNAQALYRQVL